MQYSTILANKYLKMEYKDLTPSAIKKAKECVIDCLSCIYAGIPFDSTKIVREFALKNYADGKCTVIGNNEKLVPSGACFINSIAGHGPELDDTSSEAVLHVGVIVIPAALAIAEELGLGGAEFLKAMIIGYDLQIKAGKAANPQTHLARGFHPTATCGMFASAITAAILMDLSVEQTANALGIAGSFVAGNLECYGDGSLTKRIQPGIASSSGVTAATLAARGYTGPKGIFEGPRGFFHAYCDQPREEELIKNGYFEIEGISFKPHACCRFNQTPIDAILDNCVKNSIHYEDIKTVVLELTKTGYDIVGQPAEVKLNPKNAVDAQFSAPFSIAIACIEGKAFLDEYSEESIKRNDVKNLMKKIQVRHAPDLDQYFPEAWPARVTITTNSGAIQTTEVQYARGDPQNPLSSKDLLQKFNTLTSYSELSQSNKKQIVQVISTLEDLDDIKELTKLLI